MTNTVCNRFGFRRTCVVLCVIGLLLTGIAAANTRLLQFGYGPDETKDLCLESNIVLDETQSPVGLKIQGHLYYKIGGCVPDPSYFTSAQDTMPLPLQGQKILVTYKTWIKAGSTGLGYASDRERTQRTRTGRLGGFLVTAEPVPASVEAFSVHVTVRYYGQESEERAPVAQNTKTLYTERWQAAPQLAYATGPPHDTQGPWGRHLVRAELPDDDDSLSFEQRLAKLKLEPTYEAPWPKAGVPRKELSAVRIRRLSTEPENNAAVYVVQGTDNQAGVVAVQATYKLDDDIQTTSKPVMLAYGCKATLAWINAAPKYKGDIEYKHEDHDEVLLQRRKTTKGVKDQVNNNDYFTAEHAWLTLKLASLLDDNRPLGNIPVTWQLPDNQPLNMAVFLNQTTDDNGVEWTAASQREERNTTEEGKSEIAVSARQLHKVVQGVSDKITSWRPFIPAAGKATVVADIQGQREHIEVPFVDSLWLLMRADNFSLSGGDAQGYVQLLGYLATDRQSLARRPFVGAGVLTASYDELRDLHFFVETADGRLSGRFLIPRTRNKDYYDPFFLCSDSDSCKKVHSALNGYAGPVCFQYLADPRVASVKFMPAELREEYKSCCPLTPWQPAREGQVEEGTFCFINGEEPSFLLSSRCSTRTPILKAPRGAIKCRSPCRATTKTNVHLVSG